MKVRFTLSQNEAPIMALEDFGLKLVYSCEDYWVEENFCEGFDEYEADVDDLKDIRMESYLDGRWCEFYAEKAEPMKSDGKWHNYVTVWAPATYFEEV